MKTWFNGRRGRLLTSAAGSFALVFAAGAAQAQEAPAEQEDEIVVTGFRASLRSSTATKRDADAIVESVSAEEIGKLPDNSIAESLARLPGLTAQRLFGRSQQISVRGLAPDFTTALLNGREQVSAGDNRGVEFDQYPSELLSSVVVYKTPTASLIGQGLAGTADLRTVRPLSYDERVLALSGRYEWNDVGALVDGSEENGHRITGSYIDQSADRHWGWALGVASLSSPTQAERWEAWGYGSVGPDLVVGGAKPYVQSSLLERDGVLGVLEFRPGNSFHSRLDVFYSEFNETQDLKGIEFPLLFNGSTTLQPGYTVENGLITQGTFTGIEGVVRNDVRTRESTVTAVGWNGELQMNDHWSAEVDLSYSHVERNDLDLETYSGTGPGAAAGPGGGVDDTLGFRRGNGSFIFSSVLDYTDPTLIMLTDPQGWGQAGFIKEPQTDDELRALRVTAERQLDNGPFSSMEFGVNYSERSKDKTSIESFVDLIGGNNQSVPIPTQFRTGSTALDFIGIPGMISYNPLALLNSGNVYVLRPNLNADVISKTWGVQEDVAVFYTQLNVDHEVGGIPVTGNLGIQFVNTDQSSTGAVARPGTGGLFVKVEQGDSYLEMLPSLNLSFEVGDNSFLRLGMARTMARPRMDQMRASFEVNHNIAQLANANPTGPGNSYWGGSGGNPQLRPWIADAFDVSFEHYLGNSDGYISVAAFYKQLESFIFQQTIPYDFTGFPTHNGMAVPATFQGFASAPANGSGGHIQGLELTANIPAEVFVSALEGFGVVFNASFNDSNIQPPDTPASALPGLSETVINTTVYYERGGFEARVSNRYRDDFLGEVTGFGAGRELRLVNGESVLDAQIGYRFDAGALEGLAIQFQANNITDEPFSSFINGDDRQVKDYQRYGTTYLVGLSYRH